MSFAAVTLLAPTEGASADAGAAEAMARQNKCFRCHAVDKAKLAPAFKEIARKYKGNKDAEAKLVKHVTGGGKYKDEAGKEQDHAAIKSKEPADAKNLVGWILSL